MALNPAEPGENTIKRYFQAIGLKYSPAQPYELIKIPYEPNIPRIKSFYDEFCREYDKYAKKGTSLPLGILKPDGGEVDILIKAFRGTEGGGKDNSVRIGTAFSNYWATMYITIAGNAPGYTFTGPIVNTAASLRPAFIDAVKASYTTQEKRPFFENLVSNVEKVVNSVTWSVTEISNSAPPTPAVFVETLI